MPLVAGTYRGRLGSVLTDASALGLGALVYASAGDQLQLRGTPVEPQRIAMFGRTKLISSLRQAASTQEKAAIVRAYHQSHSQFQETAHAPSATVALGAVGLGGLCGALLAAALL